MSNNRTKSRSKKADQFPTVGINGELSCLTPYLDKIKLSFTHIPIWEFCSLNSMASLKSKSVPNMLALKIGEPADLSVVDISVNVTKLALCKIHYISSLGLLFGYIIEVPHYIIKSEKNFISIVRQSAKMTKEFKGVELVFQNNHLNVLHSEMGASLVTFNERYSFVEPDYLRVGARASNTDKRT